MPTRRTFLLNTFATLGLLSESGWPAAAEQLQTFTGVHIFDRILAKADANNWCRQPIGILMGNIAIALEGTPYKGGTLELSQVREICSVNLTAFDCVTFFETTLAFARMIKKKGRTPADLLNEVRFMRYQSGIAGDFSTRLHYTSDWFADNQKKGVVKLLSDLPGAQTFTQKVGFMTSHPDLYPQLTGQKELLSKIKEREDTINSRTLKFIPLDKISAVEPLLQTGDIVGVCTSQPGLDITHTGLVFCTKDGIAHFMDASSMKRNMKVTIEPGRISQALNWSSNLTGAMFARPMEPII